jgi:hypothetical protein
MNEEYLRGLHQHLGINDNYNMWINSVKDNDDYLSKLHKSLKINDNFETWKSSIMGKTGDLTVDSTVDQKDMESQSDDGSLVYEYRTEGNKSAWGKSTDAGKTFEIVESGNIPEEWFEDPKFMEVYRKETAIEGAKAEDVARSAAMGAFYDSDLPSYVKTGMTIVNVVKALPEIAVDSEERAELGKYLKNRLDNVPEAFMTAYHSAVAAGADLFTADLDNLGYNEKQKEYRAKAEEVIVEQYKKLDKLEFKDTGKGIVAGAKEGDAAGLIAGVFGAGISMAETAIPAALTFGVSLPIQIAAPMYTDYNRAKAKALYGDAPDAIKKLIENDQTEIAIPLALGTVATGLEYIGWRGVDDYIRTMPGKGTQLAKLLWTGNREGFTEVGQLGAERLNENLGAGKSIKEASTIAWDAMTSDEGLEMWLNGFLGATQMSAAGNVVNRALRSDNASIKEVNDKINNLADLNSKKYSTRNQDVKDAVDLEIKAAEQDLKNYINEKRKINEVLTENEKISLTNTLNKKDNIKTKIESLKNQLEDGNISTKEFGYAIRGLNNQDKKLSEQLSGVQSSAITRAAEKVTETVKEQIKEARLEGKVTEMTSKEISNIEEEGFDSKTAAGEFGFIKQSPDGSFEIILNKDKPMVGTAAHEFMHAVLFKTIGANKDLQNNLGDALVEHVSKLGGDKSILGKRLAAYGQFQEDGTFVKDDNFGEETITIMSESIVDGSLKFEENFFTKIGDVVRRFSQNYLGKEITFDTGRDVYNFVKDYSKSIKEGKINKAILNVAKEGVKGKLVEGKTTPEATVQMSKDAESKTPEQLVKTIKRGANPRQVAAAEDALVPQYQALALEALGYTEKKGDILRKNVVSAVNDYYDAIVRNYDPKKGKFSTHVYNNIFPKNDTIFEKAKTLAKRDESVSMDTPEARQVAGDAGITTNLEDTFVQKIDILGFATVGRVADKIKSLVKVKSGDNFKSIISKYAGKVGELVFDIPAKKIMEGGANLAAVTKYTEGMPAPAEAQNIQRFFNAGQSAERFIKTLPLYNVTDKTADIDKVGENIEVSRNAYGIAIGLKGLPLDYFYENYTDPKALSKDPEVYKQRITSKGGRSLGLTSQTAVKRLKPEFRNPTPEIVEQFKKDIGITPKLQENIYNRDIGQLLKGAAKVYSINASLSAAQRTQEAKLKKAPVEQKKAIKQQTADITAAQSKIAFSKNADAIFGGIKSLLSEKQGKIFDDNLLQFVSTFVGINEAKMSDKQKEQVLLSEDVEAISIALNQTYGDVISKNVREDIAREIQKEVAKLKLKPKSKNIVKQEKIVEAIIKSTEDSTKKIAKYTGSDITAAKAQNDLVRQEGRRKSDAVHFVNLFDKNKEQAIADLIILGGSSFTSAKIGNGRGQFYKNSRDYYNYHLGNVGIEPVYNKNGSLNVKATAKKNGLKDIPVTKATQSSASAIKDHKNPESLKERRKHEKHARKVLNEYVAYNVARYKNGLQDNVDIMLMMNSLLSNMNSVLARAAVLKYIEPGVKAADARYEHMQPRVTVLIKLVDAHVNGDGIADINNFLVNYDIAIINKKFDKAITDAGYQSILAEGQSLDDSSLLRYYNDKTLTDSRVEVLIEVGTNKVPKLVESFMKGSDLLNPKIKEFKRLNKAIMFSRSANNETKGITVLDFDDTLATTKSGVRAKIPNVDGLPKPQRKVIFLAGGAGSGKSNVVNKLGLEGQGFKIVNQDISLEWLKKNSGLPASMNDLTKEQRSTLGKLQHQARGIARRKMMKYQGNADGVVVDGTGGSIKAMTKLVNEFKDKGYDVSMLFVETSLDVALERNKVRKERSLLDKIVKKNHEAVQGNKPGFKTMFGDRFMEVNTDKLSQEDAMPNKLVNKMDDFVSSYENRRLDAEEFANEGADILAQGGTFDFSEFDKVIEGQKAPLFDKAMKLQDKFGNKDMFVLTARPAEAAQSIFEFLKANGLNIPLKNITGLANSTSEAKALWMAEKVGEGYNDFYFADDALQNVQAVQNMLDQFDVKSKVQQAKADFVLGDPKTVKLIEETSINNVKNADRLTKPGTYNNIKFSKGHRSEYEKTISKNRPDLVKEKLVSKTVDNMFDFIDGLGVPANKKRKYEQITTKWLATSNIKLNEDGYKVKQAVEIAEKYKEDIFSYNNPNQIIEKYAGKTKAKPTNPKTVKEFGKEKVNSKRHGVTEHEVADTREGQAAVRKVMDTHFGPKSNPWCLAARSEKQRVEPRQYGYELIATKQEAQNRKQQLESEGFIVKIDPTVKDYRGIYPGKSIDGKRVDMRYQLDIKEMKEGPGVMEDAWNKWEHYSDGPKSIVFQNGKLLAFKANEQYWDRMDNATDAPVVKIKDGRVTKTVELVPYTTKKGESKVQEFVRETRTVSKDKKTVTTEYIAETQDFEAGTIVVENRVNGITVKKTRSRPGFDKQGNDVMQVLEITTYDKKGKTTSNKTFSPEGQLEAINTYGKPFGDMSVHDIIMNRGDLLSHEMTEGGVDHYHGQILFDGKVEEIGFESKIDLDIMDVIKTVDGKLRVNLKKVLEIDPNMRGDKRVFGKVKFSKGMDQNFNDILENVTGIESKKRFSAIKARKRGESKGKFRFFIPPSHEDFVGLLYNFIGKGKEGNKHRDFFEEALVRPLNRADRELNTAKQSIANDYKSLNKEFKDVKKKLTKKTPDGDFTYQDAIRVYLWDKHGHDIPGLSPTDQQNLVDLVTNDPELQTYVETLNVISKQEKYVAPTESWEVGDLRTDLDDATGRIGREEFFAEFLENADIIFSEENFNKIEAAYGADVVSAIKDMLYRIKTGQNRPSGQNKQTNKWLNYLNGSVAATMFFNIRSAVLQQMSMVNFINFGDNNILAAAKAFANQKQYWKDYATIFNSDFMKQRRRGIQTDVNGAELAASVKGAKNPAQAVIKKLLELGFLPTQIGDNNAIALGGATYYRNRINTYLKQGLSQKEAEAKAWVDFQKLAEETQQSAKPWMISMQQASPLGKVILAFQNVTSQFNRLGKKAFLDIKNRRISPEYKNANNPRLQSDMSNLSRIAYYFAIQNVIFYTLQTALFSALFDDDEEDERMLAKKERVINGTLDSVLRGTGVWGAAISTLKNMAFAYHKEREKDWNGDEASVLVEALNVSPPLGIKARKIVNAERTLNYNKKVIDEMETFDIDNPQWSANTSYIEALTNIPVNRLYNKTLNVRQSLNNQHDAYQRVLMFSGWSQWNIGLGDNEKIEAFKEKAKSKKKSKKKKKMKTNYPGSGMTL